VHYVQLAAVHRDAYRDPKLAVTASLAPDGVAPGEVGAEDDNPTVHAVAHVQCISCQQAWRAAELPITVTTLAVRLAHGAEVHAVGEPQLLHAVVAGVGHEERRAVARHAARVLKMPGLLATATSAGPVAANDARRRAPVLREDLKPVVGSVGHADRALRQRRHIERAIELVRRSAIRTKVILWLALSAVHTLRRPLTAVRHERLMPPRPMPSRPTLSSSDSCSSRTSSTASYSCSSGARADGGPLAPCVEWNGGKSAKCPAIWCATGVKSLAMKLRKPVGCGLAIHMGRVPPDPASSHCERGEIKCGESLANQMR
jgi:hypothetical protein